VVAVATVVSASGYAAAAARPEQPAARPEQPAAWVGTWAAAQVAPAATGRSHDGFRDVTVRDVVHLSAGGSEIRIRLSNLFGTRPLAIDDVRVALRRSGAQTVAGLGHPVTFGGRHAVTIGVGKREFSDPVKMPVGAGQVLAVSIFAKGDTGPATWHPAAVATSYYSTAGNHSEAAGAADYPHSMGAWYFLDGVDVVNSNLAGAVVTFGASTTDGVGSTAGVNKRYPDDLARLLLDLPNGQRLSVLNAGISGNQLLSDHGISGQSALRRFYRDAIDQSGVRAIVIWEGSNDIGDHRDITAGQLIDAYLSLITQAHEYGIAVIGATLQPDQGAAYYTPKGNRVREAVNRWIRTSGAFDAVFDFDAVLRDPFDPAALWPAYDSGDHLHPNDAGYQAIVDSIDPELFGALIADARRAARGDATTPGHTDVSR
jgi:lysophospholipase L1-like esterase